MSFEKRVYDKEFNLNDTDDSIIDYIRLHKQEIQDYSIQKVAKDLFISPNSIMRMAKKLGYSGFAELKFSLQKEESPQQLETVENQFLARIPDNICKTVDVMDEKVTRDIVDKMHQANRILFAGMGDNIPFCEIIYRYLRVVGKKVECFTQIHDLEFAMKDYGADDLVCFISASGKTQRLVDMAKKAKTDQVPRVCITHFGENPLSKECDTQICFWGEVRQIDGYDVTDKSGLMLLLRLLAEKFWETMP